MNRLNGRTECQCEMCLDDQPETTIIDPKEAE